MKRNISRPSLAGGLAAGSLLAAALLAAAPAHAYRLIQNFATGRQTAGSQVACNNPNGFVHWSNANNNWYFNPANQGAGKDFALFNAMNVWIFVPGANQTQTYVGRTAAGFATDGINAVSWGTNAGCGTGCLALTALVLQAGQVVIESDIIFNNAYAWTTNGTTYDTWSVAAHEFGHALGIHHTELSSAPLPTLYAFYHGGERTLEADDQAALQCSQSVYPAALSCIPDGGVDDVNSNTSCCSGAAVAGTIYCTNPADYGTTWASCNHICASVGAGGCAGSGGVDDTGGSTSCCSGAAVSGSTRCLNPADYGGTYASCVHTCL